MLTISLVWHDSKEQQAKRPKKPKTKSRLIGTQAHLEFWHIKLIIRVWITQLSLFVNACEAQLVIIA